MTPLNPYGKFQLVCDVIEKRVGRMPLHVSVECLLKAGHHPEDIHKLALEQPSRADSDSSKVAYTRSEQKRKDGVRTVTTPGKYLKRHFPHVPDHNIRDAAALSDPTNFEIISDIEDIIEAVVNGPASCMSDYSFSYSDHPYRAYSSEYGWKLAVRRDAEGACVGRALVNTHPVTGRPIFVRSYTQGEGRSVTDHTLEKILINKGYEKCGGWPEGLKLKAGGDLPYLDGNNQLANVNDHYLVIVYADGDCKLDRTDGYATYPEWETCEACATEVAYENLTFVGGGEEEHQQVCDVCLDRYYSSAITDSRMATEYVSNTTPTYTYLGERFTLRGLGYNGLVLATDPDDGYQIVCEEEKAVDIDGTQYLKDSPSICVDINNDYQLIKNCEVCAYSGEYVLRSDSTCVSGVWVIDYHLVDAINSGIIKYEDVPASLRPYAADLMSRAQVSRLGRTEGNVMAYDTV